MQSPPKNWKLVKIKEIVKIVNGYAFDSKYFNTNKHGIPIIRIRDINSGNSDTYYSGKYESKYLVSDGDLLIGMDGEFNCVRWKHGVALLNQRVCKIIPYGIDSNFLEYLIRPYLKTIEEKTAFVTVKHLSSKDLEELVIPVPPLHIQKKIVAVLDKAESIKQKQEKIKIIVEEIGRSLYNEMFGDPETNPMRWPIVEFSNFAIIDREIIVPSKIKSGDKYLGLEHIVKETGNITSSIDAKGAKLKSSKFTFSSEHILYGKLRPYLNKVAIPTFFGICSTDILPIKPIKGKCDRYFLAYLLKHNHFKQYASVHTAGANLPRISSKDIEHYLSPLPPYSLQQKFGLVLARANAIQKQLVISSENLEELNSALLQKSFSGNLVG